MTAQASLQSAIQAVNQGAFYYIQKPFSNDDLVAICRRAAEQRLLKAENKQLKQEIRRRERSGLVKPLGKSRAFLEVLKLAEQVAPTESTVLIQGESGTGKEVIARYIHELSARSDGGFFSLNCGALPESLLESELFGHVKGSFTGAVRDKQGLFAAARGGTFFLDEIGEMSPATQVKVLRVLQEREATPVGGTEAIPVDVRVVAATNRRREDDIKPGRLRCDLYSRPHVSAIALAPPKSPASMPRRCTASSVATMGSRPRSETERPHPRVQRAGHDPPRRGPPAQRAPRARADRRRRRVQRSLRRPAGRAAAGGMRPPRGAPPDEPRQGGRDPFRHRPRDGRRRRGAGRRPRVRPHGAADAVAAHRRREGRCSVRVALPRRPASRAVLLALGGKPPPHATVEHAHRPEPHRHGDLL